MFGQNLLTVELHCRVIWQDHQFVRDFTICIPFGLNGFSEEQSLVTGLGSITWLPESGLCRRNHQLEYIKSLHFSVVNCGPIFSSY